MLRFTSTATGEELLAEQPIHWWWPGPRLFTPTGNGYHRLEQSLPRLRRGAAVRARPAQRTGCSTRRAPCSTWCSATARSRIPFLLSSRGYGLLWNNPAIGRVELAENGTRWVADSARQIDYWVTAGTPAEILGRYADATGHAPMLPEWAAGFWQSKLRYRTQDELLEVAREYARRGLPLSVIVVDYFHWTHLGDWKFDHGEWPDPAALTAELRDMGVKLMVSVWPSVSPVSENFGRDGETTGCSSGRSSGRWPRRTGRTRASPRPWTSRSTTPRTREAREFVWGKVRDNYLRPYGIDVWWLDACEPELRPGFQGNLRYHAGPGLEVGNMYPRENARTFAEGMAEEAQTGDGQPGPFGLGGQPAVRGGAVVRGHTGHLRQPARADPVGAERGDQRHPVVDHRHRRIPRR